MVKLFDSARNMGSRGRLKVRVVKVVFGEDVAWLVIPCPVYSPYHTGSTYSMYYTDI